MIFGFVPTLQLMLIGGLTVMALLLFQLASGMRWIKIAPKQRSRTHRLVGIWMTVVAVVHGAMGLIMVTGFTLG